MHALTPVSRTWPMAGLVLSTLMASLDTSIANFALPSLQTVFDASFQQTQWIVLAYLLATTTLIVSAGRLGDVFGRRRLLSCGIVLFTGASLLCSLATTLPLLVAARALQGTGAALMTALAMAFASQMASPTRGAQSMGVMGTMSAIGTMLGPSLGGFLLSHFGWPAIFLINLPFGLINLLLVQCYMPQDRANETLPARFDHLGSGLLALALASYTLAMTVGRGHIGTMNTLLLLLAIACGGLFAVVQMRSAAPLIHVALLRNRALSACLLASVLVACVMMTTLVVGPFYLTRSLGLGTAAAGLVLAAGPMVAALSGVPAGLLGDRLGSRRACLLALAGIAASALTLAFMPQGYGIVGYLLPITCMTASYALFQAANNVAIMAHAGSEQRGVVAGLLGLARNLGLITGASFMAVLFAATDIHTVFGVAALLMVLAWAMLRAALPRLA
ncbi:MAG: MFS transporter [Massilia sp.]